MKAMIIVNTDQASLLRDNTGNVHALNTSHLPRYVYVSSIRKFLSTDCVIDYDKTFQVMTVDNYLNICKSDSFYKSKIQKVGRCSPS